MSTDALPITRGSLSERVGMEIKVAMVRNGVTGRELARRLGASQTWVSTRLTGATPLDLNELQRIADALGVPLLDLLPQSVRLTTRADSLNRALTKVDRTAIDTPATSPFSHSATRPTGPYRRDRTRPVSAIPANRRRPGWVKGRSPAA